MRAGSYDALKMPWYTTSLQHLPQLAHELRSRGGRRLQQAVTAMHTVNLMHTDLKAANVNLVIGFWDILGPTPSLETRSGFAQR